MSLSPDPDDRRVRDQEPFLVAMETLYAGRAQALA
jgi:hypothetical protein